MNEPAGTYGKGVRIVGKCWACGDPVRSMQAERIKDRRVDVTRLVHRGACADRVHVMFAGHIEH